MQHRKRIPAILAAACLCLVASIHGAAPAAAATCFGLACDPKVEGLNVVGKNTAKCSGSPANVSVYVSLEWQLPRDGGWVEIAKNKITMSVGQRRSVTANAPCTEPLRAGTARAARSI